jgi:hypothetical protein
MARAAAGKRKRPGVVSGEVQLDARLETALGEIVQLVGTLAPSTLRTRDGAYISVQAQLSGPPPTARGQYVRLQSNWVDILYHLHLLTNSAPSAPLTRLCNRPGATAPFEQQLLQAVRCNTYAGEHEALKVELQRVLEELAPRPDWRQTTQNARADDSLLHGCEPLTRARPRKSPAPKQKLGVFGALAADPLQLVTLVENLALRVMYPQFRPNTFSLQASGQLIGERVGVWVEEPLTDDRLAHLEADLATYLRLPLALEQDVQTALHPPRARNASERPPMASSPPRSLAVDPDLPSADDLANFDAIFTALRPGGVWSPFAQECPRARNTLEAYCQLYGVASCKDAPGQTVSANTLLWKTALVPPVIFVRTT